MRGHAFRMPLKPGTVDEYRRRHDAIWPDLAKAISAAGVYDYSIVVDEQTLSLFAALKLGDENTRDARPHAPVVRRWWDHMAELTVMQDDSRPVEWPLVPVFHLP